MGGLTLILHDEQFVKWKLSIIEWLFGGAFLGSQFIGKKTFIERMMSAQMTLPSKVWKTLNLCWAGFFISVGCLNVYVMFNYNTDDWVTFKTFIDGNFCCVTNAFYLQIHSRQRVLKNALCHYQ
jgi:intracellular septation protein